MNEKIRHDDGEIIIHARNYPRGQQDVTLCGNDITGGANSDTGEYLGMTKEPITCCHCLQIIRYCKNIKL